MNKSAVKKILVIQLRPFGDVLLSTSYLQALKDNFPEAKIDFLVCRPFDCVIKNHPCISDLIVSAKRDKSLKYYSGRIITILKIMKKRYDLVIDQQGGAGSAILSLLSFAKYRLGWTHARGKMYYNLKAAPGQGCYSACRNFDMLAPLGIKKQPFKLHYNIEQQSSEYVGVWLKENNLLSKQFVCIAPGSPRKEKMWSLSGQVELIKLIASETDLKVVVTYSPNEKPIAVSLVESCRGDAILGPSTTYNQIAALLKKCRLLVCNDGGINHLSVATETPAICIFGPTSPIAWSPQGVFPDHYHIKKEFQRGDDTFGIKAEDVFEIILKILDVEPRP